MTTVLADHPARKPEVEAWLDEHGIDWTFDPQLPITSIDVKASLRNQARHEPLDQEVVDRYTDNLKQGDVFPGVLANLTTADRYVLIGGNHRLYGHLGARLDTIAAYLVQVAPELALRLSYEDNRKHGKPPSTQERVQQALHLIDNGWKQADAAAAVGIGVTHISTARTRMQAARRASANGVTHEYAQLNKSVQTELGRLRSDPVFAEAVKLSAIHELGVADVKDLCRELGQAKSDQAALGLIGMKLEEAEDRARAAHTGQVGPTERSRLQRNLEGILALSPDAVAASTNRDVATTVRRQIRRAGEHLAAIDKALR